MDIQLIIPRNGNIISRRRYSKFKSRKTNYWSSNNQQDSYFKISIIFIIIISLIHVCSNSILGSRSEALYGPDDHVYLLNASTIKHEIYNSKKAWLVEFFSSWCGHCIAYAPKWKQFALDLRDWQSVVVIAGIDCADDWNVPTCRDYEIMGYPTLKLFPPMAKRMIDDPNPDEQKEGDNPKAIEKKQVLNTGVVFEKPESMTKLKTLLLGALIPLFPNLAPINISTSTYLTDPKQFWQTSEFKNEDFSFALLVYESASSHVGVETALKLSAFQKDIRVLRFHKKNALYRRLRLQKFPAAAYLTRDGSFGSILLEDNQDLVNLLVKSALGLAKITETSSQKSDPVVGKIGSNIASVKAKQQLPIKAGDSEDTVHMEDLLHAIRNLLRNEVGLFSKIDGTRLDALKNFVNILGRYFPSDRREMQMFLIRLSEWILPQREIKGAQFTEKLKEFEIEFHPWDDVDIRANSWKGCKGAIPSRRGYTCSLWQLFHTLTVNAFTKREDTPVISAIYGYVQEFFGCRECASHFSSMINRDNVLEINSIRLQMRWLWRAHNIVNLRLKGTPSEDPSYPKQLYPSSKHCPSCYIRTEDSEEFDEDNVEEYLVNIYSNIHRSKSKREIGDRDSDLPMDSGFTLNLSRKDGSNHAQQAKVNHFKWIGGFFSFTDIGIFMIVYISIALLLILGYFHFKIASKRRRLFDPFTFLRRFISS